MRTIKFKLVKDGKLQGIETLGSNGVICPAYQWDTAYQFTGAKDKNDTELYEGDLVNLMPEGFAPAIAEVQITTRGVMYYCPDFDRHAVAANLTGVVKVGTVYENPELLK